MTTGWPAVEAKGAELGITFDLWQQGAGRIALGKRADGKYAATVGGITWSIPRQVGKTFLVGSLLMIMCILFPGLKVLWTAHRTRTATNTFRSMQGLARRKRVVPHILSIRMANGEQEIAFRNGSVIMFGAREQGFGRGFDVVDVEVFDEAQILTEKALEDMVPATNQSQHPHGALLFFIGTPPRPVDPGEAFTLRREKAISGRTKDMAFIEFSADRDADPDDRAQWAKANPSFPQRTPLESMLRMRENLSTDEAWKREALGIWDDPNGASVFGVGRWGKCSGPHEPGLEVRALSLAVSMDQSTATVSAVGVGEKVVVKPLQHGPGVWWTVQRLKELQARHRVPVIVDGRGPAASLVRDLEAAKVRLHVCTTAEVLDAWDTLFKLVSDGGLSHDDYPELNAAVNSAATRSVGDRTALARRTATANISALESVMLATWWATRPKPATQPQRLPHQVVKAKATNPLLTRGF